MSVVSELICKLNASLTEIPRVFFFLIGYERDLISSRTINGQDEPRKLEKGKNNGE